MANIYRAAFMHSQGNALKVTAADVQHPGPGEVLIRNHAVALQPLDMKMLIAVYGSAAQLRYPAVLQCFHTKIYVEVDENLRTDTWQQLVTWDATTAAQIGDVSFEQPVLVEFPLQTAVAALHVFLGLGVPDSGNKEEKVLIWGTSGAVGSYVVQHRAGDKAADVVEKVRELGPYKYLFTASGDPTSQNALAALLGSTGGKFVSVLPNSVELSPDVDVVYTAFSQAAQIEEHRDWRN
ncbi:hypothetical protein EJ02DRAFT_499283 [Clathrospora elynae]|uniref:Enoyl reductase (ER) domain-containing protein n=1 Tax=Clathrospora elynae TaxID=706981 RepID=A0A6A5T604_9PLEO|nr:hypothetical protein EJ02DRAFT_499283 [Clathrospora elynae]